MKVCCLDPQVSIDRTKAGRIFFGVALPEALHSAGAGADPDNPNLVAGPHFFPGKDIHSWGWLGADNSLWHGGAKVDLFLDAALL